jgi:hypothetical protein
MGAVRYAIPASSGEKSVPPLRSDNNWTRNDGGIPCADAARPVHVALRLNCHFETHAPHKVFTNSPAHRVHPALIRDTPARGRTIRNSVNSPGSVSTSIEPPPANPRLEVKLGTITQLHF